MPILDIGKPFFLWGFDMNFGFSGFRLFQLLVNCYLWLWFKFRLCWAKS